MVARPLLRPHHAGRLDDGRPHPPHRLHERARGWSLGENIAWGTGRLATAAQIHRSWMNSPGHRANILQRSFREIGIGIETGVPVRLSAAQSGATYTADFGVRR